MIRAGQRVKYKDIYVNEEVVGDVLIVVQILDTSNKEDIGKRLCYVSRGPWYVPQVVFEEDLELVEEQSVQTVQKKNRDVPLECYEQFGQDLDGCSTQENEGCGRCPLYKNNSQEE
jgi:hypothetical protein